MPSYRQILDDARSLDLPAFLKEYRSPVLLARRVLGGSLTDKRKGPPTAGYMRAAPSGGHGGGNWASTLRHDPNAAGTTAMNPMEAETVETVVLERPYVFVLERGDGSHGLISIGRKAEADVTINDYTISGLHAHITYTNDTDFAQIRDSGSTNGTAVGTKRLQAGQAEVLVSGYWVTLGRLVCQFYTPRELHAHLLTE